MPTTKDAILKIANEICERKIYISFTGETDNELNLLNLVDNYLKELIENQNQSISLISIFNDIFPESCETNYSLYYALVLILSLANFDNPEVDDYEDFLINQIINFTIILKEYVDPILLYSSKCFSMLFKSNNQLFIRTIKLFLTSNLNYSKTVLNQIDFPPFQTLKEVQEIASLLIKTNFSSPELTSKIFDSFTKTDPINIPKQIEINEVNFLQTLVQFLFSIMTKEKNHEKFANIYKNKIYVESIVKTAEKYFAVSKDENLISDFISYLKSFQTIHNLNMNFTQELFSNIKPPNIEMAYEIARVLGAYSIHHINSPSMNNIINYLKEITDYCFSNIVVDESSTTTQFVNFINSNMEEIHIYPYKKIERLCFYLFYKSDKEIRSNSFELLFKVSKLFEKENSDWTEYEFSAQPLYRQLHNEFASYIKKNNDFIIDESELISSSSSLNQALKYILRRFSNCRSEFCAKVMKDCLQICDIYPFMLMLLFTSMTPYLLRQKCTKNIQIKHKTFYNLARSNPEALTMLEPSYLIEYLHMVADTDIELFVQLTKSALLGIKSIKKEQLQAEIDTLCLFNRCSNPSLVAQSLLNITAQLEVLYPQDQTIDLTKLNSTILNYLVTFSMTMKLNSLISDSFITYSNFLIKNGIDYKISFIEQCDIDFFESIYNKFSSKKEEITFEALHFIPSVVTKFFLNPKIKSEAASSIKPEIIGFLISPKSSELTELFKSKYQQIEDPSEKKNIISSLNDKEKKSLLNYCLKFINSTFVEEIGQRIFDVIYMLKDVTPISQIRKDTLNNLYLFFFKHPNISPRDLFFENEDESYRFFKHFVELGASDILLQDLLKNCPFSKSVSEHFLTEEWNFIESKGYEKINKNSIKAFNAMIANEEVADELPKAQNLGAFHFYLKKIITNAIKDESLGIDLFASILTNDNKKLEYQQIVELFITEMTEQIKSQPDSFDCSALNSFFEICTIVVYLGDEGIIHSVYNFIDLVLSEDSLKKKLFDQSFVSNIVKLSMIDDSFLSIITESKMKIKIPDYINLDEDKEVKFWYNAIFRKFENITKEDFDFILSCIEMALEFNSVEMKQRCLMILSIIMPEKHELKEKDKESIIKFLQFAVLSKNVDEKFGHHISLFIDEAVGPLEIKFTDVDINVYKNTPDDVREYFKRLISDNN